VVVLARPTLDTWAVAYTFLVQSDRDVVLIFEPTGQPFELLAGESLTIRWDGLREDGVVALEAGHLVIHTPMGGSTLAWDSSGAEIYVGADSGPDAR
jgi:hypothetical protein